jgi:hypothetical protein
MSRNREADTCGALTRRGAMEVVTSVAVAVIARR